MSSAENNKAIKGKKTKNGSVPNSDPIDTSKLSKKTIPKVKELPVSNSKLKSTNSKSRTELQKDPIRTRQRLTCDDDDGLIELNIISLSRSDDDSRDEHSDQEHLIIPTTGNCVPPPRPYLVVDTLLRGDSNSPGSSCSPGSVSSGLGNNYKMTNGVPGKVSGLTASSRSRSVATLSAPRNQQCNLSRAVSARKLNNKWDAVMSKISSTKIGSINIKEVKSKVYSAILNPPSHTQPPTIPESVQKQCDKPNTKSKLISPNSKSTTRTHRHPRYILEIETFSSRSPTLSVSDSSVDEIQIIQELEPPRNVKQPRVRKETVKSKRQMSDLSSNSDYSTSNNSQKGSVEIVSAPPPAKKRPGTTKQKSVERKPLDSYQRNNGTQKVTSDTTCANSGSFPVPPTSTKTATLNYRNTKRTQLKASDQGSGTTAGATIPTSKSQPSSSFRNPTAASLAKDKHSNQQNINPAHPTKSTKGVRIIKEKQTTRLGFNHELEYADDKVVDIVSKKDAEIQQQRKKFEEEIAKLHVNNQKALEIQKTELERRLTDIRLEFEKERECHKEEICAVIQEHEKHLAQIEKRFRNELSRVKQFYEEKLEAQKQELSQKYIDLRVEYDQDREFKKDELQSIQNSHADDLVGRQEQFNKEIFELNKKHEDELTKQRNDLESKHLAECSRLKDEYNSELEAIRLRSLEPSDNVNLLTGQPSDILLKEVDSLRYVVDMRSNEVKASQKELMKYKMKYEELTGVQSQNVSLVAKVEDLGAQLEKSRQDKTKLLENIQTLEVKQKSLLVENDKLHLLNEELKWRMNNMDLKEELVESSVSRETQTD